MYTQTIQHILRCRSFRLQRYQLKTGIFSFFYPWPNIDPEPLSPLSFACHLSHYASSSPEFYAFWGQSPNGPGVVLGTAALKFIVKNCKKGQGLGNNVHCFGKSRNEMTL